MFLTVKYLLALKCLLAAHRIDASDPELHVQLLRFRQVVDNVPERVPTKISETVVTEFENLLPKSQDLREWNDSFLSSHKASVLHVQAALTARLLLNSDSKPQCEEALLATLDLEDASISKAVTGLELLGEWGSSHVTKSAYVEKAHERWKGASAFQPR
jgi:N-alpha-acetyltransferase 15/16, NatA auxiliary subunit